MVATKQAPILHVPECCGRQRPEVLGLDIATESPRNRFHFDEATIPPGIPVFQAAPGVGLNTALDGSGRPLLKKWSLVHNQ